MRHHADRRLQGDFTAAAVPFGVLVAHAVEQGERLAPGVARGGGVAHVARYGHVAVSVTKRAAVISGVLG